jgi:hypothetical protein
MENEIGKEKMVFSILVGRLAAARRWTGGGEVSGRSIGGEGWRHQARLGRWASLWEWGNGGVAETAQGGDICRRQGGAVVAGGGPCIILESKEGGGVKWQPKWKETERWRRSPGRRKAATLSHDSDEMVVPSGRRRLNRRQGEAKGAVKSSV